MIRFFIYILLLYIGVNGQSLRGNTFLQPFYGSWYVSYTNINFSTNPTKCMQYYMAQDADLQFVYTFKKVHNHKNPEYQSGTIHIDNMENLHQWRLTPDKKDTDDKLSFSKDNMLLSGSSLELLKKAEFIQHVLHIDKSKRYMIISNNKKNKIYILTRSKIQNEDEKIVNEIYDILHETVDMSISLYSINNSFC